ncbi:tyrosine-type recombinase/integrase [Escherichia coli]|nr:tyrosine-type recombinase/integrase [Escherichia coli]
MSRKAEPSKKEIEQFATQPIEDGKSKQILTIGSGLILVKRKDRKSAAWAFRYSMAGKGRQELIIGSFERFTLKQAKEIARKRSAEVALDKDPLQGKREAKKEQAAKKLTVGMLVSVWFDTPAVLNLARRDELRQTVEKHIIPTIGKIPAETLETAQVNRLLRDIAEQYKTTPKFVLWVLKNAYAYHHRNGLVKNDPVNRLKASDFGVTTSIRERVLTSDEIAQIVDKADEVNKRRGLVLRLLLSLAVRKMELLAAEWAEFDLDAGVWRLPAERTKTKKGIDVPLSPIVIGWLKELKTHAGDSAYVCPAEGKSQKAHLSDHALNKLLGKITPPDSEPVTPHDLRRTARTMLADLGVDYRTAEMCLNHQLAGVERHYNHAKLFDQRREALLMLSERVATLTGSNIIPLKKTV